MVLKALNPTGTGKLVLFETHYGTTYTPIHYLVFILLGIAGGLFGGVFCKANFLWSKSFRKFTIIKDYPVFEVFLVVLATGLVQYPNPMTREPGDVIIRNLLQDCRNSSQSWIVSYAFPAIVAPLVPLHVFSETTRQYLLREHASYLWSFSTRRSADPEVM